MNGNEDRVFGFSILKYQEVKWHGDFAISGVVPLFLNTYLFLCCVSNTQNLYLINRFSHRGIVLIERINIMLLVANLCKKNILPAKVFSSFNSDSSSGRACGSMYCKVDGSSPSLRVVN